MRRAALLRLLGSRAHHEAVPARGQLVKQDRAARLLLVVVVVLLLVVLVLLQLSFKRGWHGGRGSRLLLVLSLECT